MKRSGPARDSTPERIQKVLARVGAASRRGAEQLIVERRVTVNGEVVGTLGLKVDAQKDDIRVDGVRLARQERTVYLVLNKPKGVVSTRRDPSGRTTIMDLVPSVPGLFPVGRLDVMTEGLILLTNDGAFAERVAHPRYETPRTYHAKVRGLPDAATLERLVGGVYVDGERLVADRVRVIEAQDNAWLELTLHEGKQHEVRRLLERAGHPVSKLRRVSIGCVCDPRLEVGQFRELTPREVRALMSGKLLESSPARRGPAARRRPRPRPQRTRVRPR
jgi:23S rRNA pseudouridine2605 synthase